jgi:lipopolysaccharide/colanic/teichoic acid biosynthesis glycosyltransferase
MQKIPMKTQFRSTFPDLKSGFWNRHLHQLKKITLAIIDLLSMSFALGLAFLLRYFIFQGFQIQEGFWDLFPFLFLSLGIFLIAGLYTSGISPVQELRDLTLSVTVVFLSMAGLSSFEHISIYYPHFLIGVGWVLSLVIVPQGREFARTIFSRNPFWGEPVVVIGYGPAGYEIAEYLVDNPQSGLFPVVVVDRRTADRNLPPRVPVIRATDILEHPDMIELFKSIPMAILVTNEINEKFVNLIVEERVLQFRRLVVISNSQQINSLWLRSYSIGEMLGFEIGQNLLNPWQRKIKRLIDLGLILIFLPILIPLFLIISLLIKLDSPGKIFSHEMRVGHKDLIFKMWEFRTLYSVPEEKKKKDPQVTRMGEFLNRSRLVNLPQLFNVLHGEMSLFGPLPIVQSEVQTYGQVYSLYSEVLPGITGLWQISGRRYLSYSSRVHLDEYYIRNWSIWLDYYILTHTSMMLIKGGKSL